MERRAFLKGAGATLFVISAPAKLVERLAPRSRPHSVGLVRDDGTVNRPVTDITELASVARFGDHWDAADVTWYAVTGNAITGCRIYDERGDVMAGLNWTPTTPNGGDVTVRWPAEGMIECV